MLMKLRELLTQAENRLNEAGVTEYKTDAWLLFLFVSQKNRTWYLMHMNDETDEFFSNVQIAAYDEMIKKRCTHMPLQHITGHQEFMGLDFLVNEYVLIPRQDTEVLVEEALKIYKDHTEMSQVLDLCTGSGCIAISMKKLANHPIAVTAVDLSEKALETAKTNAEKNSCEVTFVLSDLFQNLERKQYDMILSNPPYICSDVIPTLMEEVKDYEPHMALDGEKDGLHFYREITKQAKDYLLPGGYLLYEIGCEQADDVENILYQHEFIKVRTKKDFAGLNRVVIAQKQE